MDEPVIHMGEQVPCGDGRVSVSGRIEFPADWPEARVRETVGRLLADLRGQGWLVTEAGDDIFRVSPREQ